MALQHALIGKREVTVFSEDDMIKQLDVECFGMNLNDCERFRALKINRNGDSGKPHFSEYIVDATIDTGRVWFC